VIINLSYDSSADSAPIGFKNSLNSLVSFLQSTFSDPVTVNIAVGYGEVAGTPLGNGALGSSSTFMQSVSYTQLKNALVADASSATDNSAVASLPAADPIGTSYMISLAEAKALNLSSSSHLDGYVGFNSGGVFDYDSSDGITTGKHDFYGAAAHEITEVMGRMMWGGGGGSPTALNLFHFSAPGVRTFSGTTAGYFSANNGVTNLDSFNTDPRGDFGDWASSAGHDAFLAFGGSGAVESISPSDLKVMDALGWDQLGGSPDLTVSNVVATPTAIGFTINNAGTAAAGTSVSGIYLSTDAVITSADTLLATSNTPALAAASSDSESASFTLPGNLPNAGTYYLGVLADSTNTVAEAKEANNTAAVPVILGNGNDNALTGTSSSDSLWGFAGNDSLNGGTGKDLMFGGIGNDLYTVDSTGDVITENAGEGTDTVRASISYTLGANVENATLTGAGNLKATGNAADNVIIGNSGNNSLIGLGGADTLDGGSGVDTVLYSASHAAVNVSLATGTGSGGDAQGDSLSNIENVTGSSYADTIEGSSGNNVLKGGSGTDTLSYAHAASGVAVNLSLTTAQATGGAGTDSVSSFENLTGSDFNDSLTGSTTANVLTGGNGNDTMDGGAGGDKLLGGNGGDQLIGGDGNDSLTGGGGADILTGGLGTDRFIFTAAADTPAGAGADRIADFNHAESDKIDLSAIDANTVTAGDQAFTFIDNQPFHHVSGELHYVSNPNGIVIEGDVNGDGVADFAVNVNGVTSVASGDFVL